MPAIPRNGMSSGNEKTTSPDSARPQDTGYPVWAPRFWHGMRSGDWLRLLAQHRFRISPGRLPMAGAISFFSMLNSVLHRVQQIRHGRRIERTAIEKPPVFIIGHWRSGTTFLHELLVRDPQFAYPTTYECFAPSHFLVSEWIIPKLIAWLMPKKRPMDNMGAGFDYPQEDEFALANLGCPTPYLHLAFPNDPPCYLELLDMVDVAEPVRERWERDVVYFVRALTLAQGRRLVLKSPPHTGRMGVLSRLFPGAKFIHIARHPEKLFISTRRLWWTLSHVQGLQVPHDKERDAYIFACFERMYRGFEQQRSEIEPGHLCDIRYEDLVRDPMAQVQAIYEQLDLGGFAEVRETMEACLRDRRGYQPNRHQDMEPEIRVELRRRWSDYYERYGYAAALARST